MKYTLLFLLFIFLNTESFSQRSLFNQKYISITEDFDISENELETFKNEGKLEIFNTEKHKTNLAAQLLKLRNGRSKTFDKGYYKINYKVIGKQQIPHYRVRYIYIDKSKFESNDKFEAYLNKVRGLLEHTAFKSVAMQYSMDYKKHVGGDSGWFKQGKTDRAFFDQISAANRLAEEVFEFEIPQNQAYYFVQKTHAKMDIEEVLVLQTKKD